MSERITNFITALTAFARDVHKFVRQHVEVCVWLPCTALLLWLGWYITWRSGLAVIEVGPIVMDLVVQTAQIMVLLWLTWLAKKAYWSDLSDSEEQQIEDEIARGDVGENASGNRARRDKSQAWFRLIADRAQFVLMFVLILLAKAAYAQPASVTCARDLVVRWEVTSPATYTARYERPVWPKGASGVTWGVGYDGGHQPRHVILRDWAEHPEAHRLAETAGVTGPAAGQILPRYRDVIVKWSQAVSVLDRHMLPRYRMLARQAYGPRFDAAPPCVQGALTSETLNRGPGMVGDRRKERRVIRDVCLALPPGELATCTAQQLEASCRVWADDPINGRGLCARRRDEARVALL